MDRQYCGVYHHHVVGVDVYLLDDGETNMNEDEKPTTTENNGGKTGWPPGLLQDDSKGLSKLLSNRPDAKRRVREALAEQPAQQEPVAAQSVMTVRIWRDKNSDQNAEFKNWHKLPDGEHILYTSPPAQRTWVGLTPEELDEMFSKTLKGKKLVNWVARVIETKLKEKNT